MALRTKSMTANPDKLDDLRVCVMRDGRIYNHHLASFMERFQRPMYDMHLKLLAPPLELKNGYKRGEISWEEYVPIFRKEVLEPQSILIKMFAYMALNNNLTFLCSEKTPEKCHRRLLAEECKKYQPNLEVIIE